MYDYPSIISVIKRNESQDLQNIMKRKCSILGAPVNRLPWGTDEKDFRCKRIKEMLREDISFLCFTGVKEWHLVPDEGIGMFAGEILTSVKEQLFHDLIIRCTLPCSSWKETWQDDIKKRNDAWLLKCSHIKTLPFFQKSSLPGTNMYSALTEEIEDSQLIIGIYDLNDYMKYDDAVDYAVFHLKIEKKHYRFINPSTLQYSRA